MPMQRLMVSWLYLKTIDYALHIIILFYQQIHFVDFEYGLESKIFFVLVLWEKPTLCNSYKTGNDDG
jgi:hypothetical protein